MDIIIDIDGTVADAEHRMHLIAQRPKNYDEFYRLVANDKPIIPVIRTVRAWQAAQFRLIFCTGRPEKTRADTEAWLVGHVLQCGSPKLYMRADNDYRPDTRVKTEAYEKMLAEGFKPVLAIDDRPRICKMWKELGLTVLRVGEHDDF